MTKFADILAVAIVALFIGGTAIGIARMVGEPERYIHQPQQFSLDGAEPAAGTRTLIG